MVGVVIGSVLGGVVFVVVALIYLLDLLDRAWESQQRQQYTDLTHQIEGLRAVMRLDLAGRHARTQLLHLLQGGGDQERLQ